MYKSIFKYKISSEVPKIKNISICGIRTVEFGLDPDLQCEAN